MSQNKPQSPGTTRLIILVLAYGVMLFWMQRTMTKPQAAAPQTTQAILAEAQSLDQQGRTNTQLTRADRIKKLERAVTKYEDYYNANKKAPDAAQARFNEINIYDFLAQLEGPQGGNNYLDQAERRLKDMQKQLLRQQGTVKLEIDGKAEERTGDLGRIADERLNDIRKERDVRNRRLPLYQIMDFFVRITGKNPNYSYWLALVLIVAALKVISFPFQKKQYQYQQDMMRVQPLVKEAQEKLKGRPQEEINKRVFQIYKENNVNVAGGCLPMLVTMVTLFPVFYMVRDYEYQFTAAKFFWIGSPLSFKTPWLAHSLAGFDVPLFVLYSVTTALSMLLQPKPVDPQQAQQQKMMMYVMPAIFAVMMWMYQWPAAFMLYWLVLNIISSYQSWVLGRHFGLYGKGGGGAALATAGGPSTPVLPTNGNGAANGKPAPVKPLTPMKNVHQERKPERKEPEGPPGLPGRVRPRRPRR